MVCLTFDTDWMNDATLGRFIREVDIPGSGTFFCHEAFRCLQNQEHEIAPHPFISDLTNWRDDLAALTTSVNPTARGTRTHSCAFSHMVAVGLHEMGFTYVSQATGLFQPGLRPFRHPWGVWELPIYYMDNMDFWMATNWPGFDHRPFSPEWIARATEDDDDLFVFDFHPVHIALNTRTPADYQQVKERIVSGGASPFDLAYGGRGVRAYFEELCDALLRCGLRSLTCSGALAALTTRADIALP